MSKHEFRDEDGNVIDPSEIESGGYEVVDGAPAVEQAPVPTHKGRKVVAASAAVIALLAGGGGAAYVLTSGHGGGPAPVAAPSSSASVVAPSSSTLASSSPSSSLTPSAANGVNSVPLPPLDACVGGVRDAAWPEGAPKPTAGLRVLSTLQLPPTMTGLIGANVDQQLHRMQILQTGANQLGVYWDQRDSGLNQGWWKTTIETSSKYPVIAGEGQGAGHDVDFPGACRTTYDPGLYRVAGEGIPRGAVDAAGRVEVAALKVDSSSLRPDAPQVVWIVVRTQLLKTELLRAGGGSSSASASTTPATGGGER